MVLKDLTNKMKKRKKSVLEVVRQRMLARSWLFPSFEDNNPEPIKYKEGKMGSGLSS